LKTPSEQAPWRPGDVDRTEKVAIVNQMFDAYEAMMV
jgi:hypothetical protein